MTSVDKNLNTIILRLSITSITSLTHELECFRQTQ